MAKITLKRNEVTPDVLHNVFNNMKHCDFMHVACKAAFLIFHGKFIAN